MKSIGSFQPIKILFIMITFLICWCWIKQDNDILEDSIRHKTVHMSLNNISKNYKEERPNQSFQLTTLTQSRKVDYFIPVNLRKKDWHNYTQIKYEKSRVGIGEQGQASHLKSGNKSTVEKIISKNGFNVPLSIKLPLNRSLPDIRPPKCRERWYLESLPTVSIIVPFHNEHWSLLLRTVYSVLFRSPEHLIKEIFLCDDGSNKVSEAFKKKLKNFQKEHSAKVKVLRLANHTGLVAARMLGAKAATGDVLVFLDSHVEVNVNWLPPLLEPIALNYRVLVCPHIDWMDHKSFQYQRRGDGLRGGFDWMLYYQAIPLLPKGYDNMPEPFETPVMMGGLFAISRTFFWELGGYDSGFLMWGSEQFEMSFKVWQCGGRILDAPCSRVGHLFRNYQFLVYDMIEEHFTESLLSYTKSPKN